MRNFTAKNMRNRSSTFKDRRDRRSNDARRDPVEEGKEQFNDELFACDDNHNTD